MPSENRQCQGRWNMGGHLIPDPRCRGRKRFWSGHWCFPKWCRYGYGRGGPEWSWRYVYLERILSSLRRLLVQQWCCSTLKAVVAILKSIRWRTGSQCRPARTGVMWQVPRLLCNNSSKGVLNHLKASKIWMWMCSKKRIAIVEPRANYCNGYHFFCLSGQGWTNAAQSSNVKVWCLTNLWNMLIERHYESLGKHLDFL